MNSPTFGFSLGYPIGLKEYLPAISHVIGKGITSFRIIEPWCKGFDTDHQKFSDLLKWLVSLGAEHFLIGIHGLPHSWLSRYDLSVLDDKQRQAATWFNRFPLKEYEEGEYSNLINDFIIALDMADVLNKCSFEIGHEPNASKYFWGTHQQWVEIVEAASIAIKPENAYCCNFSSGLIRNGKDPWRDWIQNGLYANWYYLSHSFYWTDGGGTFDPLNNTYPTRQFSDIIVSEYNMFTKIAAGSAREAQFNSPLYVTRLFELLKFLKDKPVSTVYLHCLVDDSRDKVGRLGMWQKQTVNGKAQYYPKEASKQFMKVWDTNVGCAGMVRGFEVLDDRIKTPSAEIVFQNDGSWEIT